MERGTNNVDFGWIKTMFSDLNDHSISTKIIFILITIATLGYVLRMIIPLIYAIIDIFNELFAFKKRHKYRSLEKKECKNRKKRLRIISKKEKLIQKNLRKVILKQINRINQ